jgi:hypothetical protein
LLLSRIGTTDTLRRLTARSRRPSADPELALWAVRRAANVAGGECLPQAVALTVLLQGAGGEPELILGCRRDGANGWLAHAWVEQDGKIFNPAGTEGFIPLAVLSAQTGWIAAPLRAKS